jgi:lysozyme family protein
VADLRALTLAEARQILRWRIDAALTRWHFDRIAYEPLRLQLLDFAWNSGEGLAVRQLQRAVRLPEADVDGILGPQTLAALARHDAALVHNALAAQRARMVQTSRKIAKKFKGGVIARALSFVI